jgi:uncharacterized tellurite resistance protein B-like protein
MKDLREFTDAEKLFLAGCLKSIILADGGVDEQEVDELDVITQGAEFEDFSDYLEKFEAQVKDTESFWAMAKGITDDDTQKTILDLLDDMAIQDGFKDRVQTKFLEELRQHWAGLDF